MGETEIGDFRFAIGVQEDICGFEIAMDDTGGVCRFHGMAEFQQERQAIAQREGADIEDSPFEGLRRMGKARCGGGECRGDVFHDEEGAFGVLSDIVDMDNMGGVEACGGSSLSKESGTQSGVVAMGGAQAFDGDEAAEPEIGSEIDDSHSAFSDDGLDFVVCLESGVMLATERTCGGAIERGGENRRRRFGSDRAACQIEYDGGFFLIGSCRSDGIGWVHVKREGMGKTKKPSASGRADGFIFNLEPRAVKSGTIPG